MRCEINSVFALKSIKVEVIADPTIAPVVPTPTVTPIAPPTPTAPTDCSKQSISKTLSVTPVFEYTQDSGLKNSAKMIDWFTSSSIDCPLLEYKVFENIQSSSIYDKQIFVGNGNNLRITTLISIN